MNEKIKHHLAKNYIDLVNLLSKPIKLKALEGCWVIINFHQVSDNFIDGIHNKGTWTPTNVFEDTIENINKKYGFVSLSEGIDLLRNNQIGKKTLFSLTFDDGDISILDKALPFLIKNSIPAALFINSAYLTNDRQNWARAFNYLEQYHPDIIKKQNLKNEFLALRNSSNIEAYNTISRKIDSIFGQLNDKPKFTIDFKTLQGLDINLCTIGLHSNEHHRLSMLTYIEQKKDIEINIKILSELPHYKPYWAIPFGIEHDWNRDTIKIAIENDLNLFFHAGGVNRSFNELGLNRIPCDNKTFKDIPQII